MSDEQSDGAARPHEAAPIHNSKLLLRFGLRFRIWPGPVPVLATGCDPVLDLGLSTGSYPVLLLGWYSLESGDCLGPSLAT